MGDINIQSFDIYEKLKGFGPFAAGPLASWQFINCGVTIPGRVTLSEASPTDATSPPLIERVGEAVIIHFNDVARFQIGFDDRTITGFDINPKTGEAELIHILHDHIAPRVLADLGELVLHASAVRFGDRSALFLGQSGAGKSTLAASLHQAGYPLLGDDAICVTRGSDRYCAQAVYPSLRLYPEVIAHLLGVDATTSPVADGCDKQNVFLAHVLQTPSAPLALSALFFLDGDCDPTPAKDFRMDPIRACIALIEQSFTLDPHDVTCAARRLAKISQLATEVPAYRLPYAHDFANLPKVHETIATIINGHGPNAPDCRAQAGRCCDRAERSASR